MGINLKAGRGNRNGLWWAMGKEKIGGDLNRDMSDFTFEIDFRLQRLWAGSLFSLMVPSHLLFVFLAFILSPFRCECQAASCSELVVCFGRPYLKTLWTKFKPGSSVALCLKTFIYEIAPKTSCTEMGKHWSFLKPILSGIVLLCGDCLLVNFESLTVPSWYFSSKVATMKKAPQGHETTGDLQKAMLCLIKFRQMMEWCSKIIFVKA